MTVWFGSFARTVGVLAHTGLYTGIALADFLLIMLPQISIP